MKISLILVNHNGGLPLLRNLRLLLSETNDCDSELIVVDNASTDGSGRKVGSEFPEVRLILEKDNLGYAFGVNRGTQEATGDLMIIMNPDIKPQPGAISLLVRAAEDNPHISIFGGVIINRKRSIDRNCARSLPGAVNILREGFFLPHRRIVQEAGLLDPGNCVVEIPAISGAIMAITRKKWERLGEMDADYFLYNEDLEWCRRARQKGEGVAVVPGALFLHEGGASTRLNEGRSFAARVLADFQYFYKDKYSTPDKIRRLWRTRTLFRSWLYQMDTWFGILGRRSSSKRRAAIYRLLFHALGQFRWSTAKGIQHSHPSRLVDFPATRLNDLNDNRPVILQVVPNMEIGGTQRLIESLVTGPLSKEFRFEILCLTHLGSIGERLRDSGHHIFTADLSGWRNLRNWRRASDYMALFEPDLCHSHLLAGDIATRLGRHGNTPWVSTKHGVDLWMSPLLRFLEKITLRKCNRILAVSDAVATAKQHIGFGGVLPAVVQSPPSVTIQHNPAPLFSDGQPIRLLCLGRLHQAKRVDLFVRMAAELEEHYPGRFSFRIVGDGEEAVSLRSLVDELKVDKTIEFRDATDNVAAEIDDSDIVFLFSEREGFALVVLEALARGRIPVVRRIPGTTETLPSSLNECFVDSSSHAEFVAKTIQICENSERFIHLVRDAMPWLEERQDYASTMKRLYMRALPETSNRKMRVLHLITRLIVGGAQENTIASVERVDPQRYESHLWIGPQTGTEGSLIDNARRRGITLHIIPNLVREINIWKDLLVTIQLARLFRRESFDIIHTHSSKAGIVGRLAAAMASMPHIVHTVHGWGFHDHMSPLLRKFYVVLERIMQRWTYPLVSVSNRTTQTGLKEKIARPEQYRMIRSGIPLKRFFPDRVRRNSRRRELGIGEEEIVIGSIGRLSPQKNPFDFLRVASRLLGSHKNLRFIYIGDGPLRERMEAAKKEANVGNRLLLLGLRNDVPDLLRIMDITIHTSLWEGLPRVIPQSLATGVPVVAYNIDGIEESVIDGRNGFVIEPRAIEDMAAKLSLMISDTSLRSEMGKRALQEFDHSFSEDAMIMEIENMYDELTRPMK